MKNLRRLKMNQVIKSYDKNNKLVIYAEIDNNMELSKLYKLSGRKFYKFSKDVFTEDKKTPKKKLTEINKVIINYADDCELLHFHLDGESFCRVKKTDCTSLISPKVISKVSLINDLYYENFTIKPELVSEWLKKL